MTVLSGLITVTTAGTAVVGPSTPDARAFGIKAHPDNADTVWVGNDGANDVTSSNGFPCDPGEGLVLAAPEGQTIVLSDYYFDADSNGDKWCWVVLQL